MSFPDAFTKLKKRNTKVLLAQLYAIYNGMFNSPLLFPNCTPTLAAFLLLIQALDQQEQVVARTKATGAAQVRNAKRDDACVAAEQERAYVLSLCHANPEQAQALILAAAMHVAAIGDHSKALLSVLLVAGQPGVVNLKGNRKLLTAGRGAKRTQINWRYTVDGGKTFVTSNTPLVHTTITGLPSGVMVGFQASVTDSKGTSDWCPMVSVLIH